MKKKDTALIVGSLLMLAGVPSAQAVVTTYNVTQTFNQVVYNVSNPTWDTIFTGSFTFDSDTQTVSNLSGSLSQAMSGNTTFVQLNHQLSSVSDGMGNLLVSVFAQNTTDVFQGGGFATGGRYTFGNNNAYVTINVNLADPTAALTQAQINTLAYADCSPGGLMGMTDPKTVCMTGWVNTSTGVPTAGGTMQGTYPITQEISAVPVPAAAWLLGSGLIGLVGVARQRKAV